jgi:hypothetical protein
VCRGRRAGMRRGPAAVQGQPAQPTPTFGATPTAPAGGGVAVPGMVIPAQPQPGQSPSVHPSPQPPGQITRPSGRGGAQQ